MLRDSPGQKSDESNDRGQPGDQARPTEPTSRSVRLTLHIGPHKSGSSAIQHVLRSTRFRSFYYPKTGQWPDGSHHRLVFSLIPELAREDTDIQTSEAYIGELRREIQSSGQEGDLGRILISSEFLGIDGQLAARLATRLVDEGLVSNQSSVDTVLVAREHILRASSLFNQAVKDPVIGETRSPDRYLREERNTICYGPVVRSLLDLKIPVQVVGFEPAETLVQRFLKTIGADDSEIPCEAPRRNIGLCRTVMLGMLAVNRVTTDIHDRQCFFQALKAIRPAFRKSTNIFSRSAVDEVIDGFIKDAQWLEHEVHQAVGLNKTLEQYSSQAAMSNPLPIRLQKQERIAIDSALSDSRLQQHACREQLTKELDRLMENP